MKASVVASLASLVAVAMAADNPYASYPSVAHTASINGFADPIYDKLPDCAKDCVKESTSNTPCPYWDPGCLCYMPQWGTIVADCFVDNCPNGDDVQKAVDLAVGICDEVGAGKWVISAEASSALAAAETRVVEASTSAAEATTSAAGSSSPASTAAGSSAAESSSAGSSAVSSPAVTSGPAATTAASSSEAAATTSAAEEGSSDEDESSSEAAAPTSSAAQESAGNATSTSSPSDVEQSNGAGALVGSIVAPVAAIAGALLLA